MVFTRPDFIFVKPLICKIAHRKMYYRAQSRQTMQLALCILAFLCAQLSTIVPGGPFSGQALASTYFAYRSDSNNLPHRPLSLAAESLTGKNTPSSMPISSGVVLSTGMLKTKAGSVHVSTLDVDLANSHLRLGVVQAGDSLISSDETVSSMADRTGAIAGINGDFFEVNGPGRPIGMVTINGRLLQSPTSYAVLGVTQSGSLTIGPESFSGNITLLPDETSNTEQGRKEHTESTPASQSKLKHTRDQASYPLNSVNIYNEASKGNLVLLTPDLGTPPSIAGDTAALLQPADSDGTFIVGSVLSVDSLSALADQYALAGSGDAATWLTTYLHNGDRLKVSENIAPDAHLEQAIGGGPVLIKNGAIYHDPHPPAPKEANVRNPLTAISVTRDGRHASLIVFDGRRTGSVKSVGLTRAQATNYLLAHGAYKAMLFDSGGSSDMVARLDGQLSTSVVNSPADGVERPVANGLFVYDI